MTKSKICVSMHPNMAFKLKCEAEKYHTTPQKIIKDLLRNYYEIDPDTGEFPVYRRCK